MVLKINLFKIFLYVCVYWFYKNNFEKWGVYIGFMLWIYILLVFFNEKKCVCYEFKFIYILFVN